MEIAVKLFCTFAVYLLYMLEIIEAQARCKVPNGDAGTCIHITECQPLLELSKKKFKTPHENMYYQQSYCGGHVRNVKVCCPSLSVWDNFEPNPVLYPNQPLETHTLITKRPVFSKPETSPPFPKPVVLTMPQNSGVGNRNLPEVEELNQNCGWSVAAIDQYPWLALLENANGLLNCGGSLISHRFVLTAAHCISGRGGEPVLVRLAEYNTSSFPIDSVETDGGGLDNVTVELIPVKDTYAHPNFNLTLKIHDIGLVEMIKEVKFGDFIKVICLPEMDFMYKIPEATNFTIAGWGATSDARESEVKKLVSIPYVPLDKCGKEDRLDLKDTQICAGGVEGKDSCSGDSGGPLMYLYNDKMYVVGVLSYGSRICGKEGRPAIHTNVHKYMSWIKDTLSGKLSI